MLGPLALHETVQIIQQQPPFKNILETSSTDQGYQQMTYVSSYAHLPPTMSQSYLVQSSTPLQKQLAASGSYQVSPMLTAVPTNNTIHVESMANPPPHINDSNYDNLATVTFTRIQSKSKRNPNNRVFKQQRVGPVGQRSTPKSIGHETSPHDKTEQRPTSSSDIVIRRTIGKSLAVRGTTYDQKVSMIVDTAAMIILVNEKLIPGNEDSETVTLRGLGEQLVTGKIIKNTSLDIDRVNIQWDVCKAPLTDDVLLGLDILDTLCAVINLSTPTLTINNKVINAAFVNSGGEISIQQVCIKRTITVPPNSAMTVTIKTNKSADQEFILEPCPLTSCVLVSNVVCTISSEDVASIDTSLMEIGDGSGRTDMVKFGFP
ncbi:unnamed protein product [Mytilus coruscus]|uniref:Retropepsins domain-containing protein n=1 Tax=Mytilus coruscus TaxID=42192 RepID=A0A6J8D3C9_MYTCO|nr:unnamed protein product [Mytilus coruscus]